MLKYYIFGIVFTSMLSGVSAMKTISVIPSKNNYGRLLLRIFGFWEGLWLTIRQGLKCQSYPVLKYYIFWIVFTSMLSGISNTRTIYLFKNKNDKLLLRIFGLSEGLKQSKCFSVEIPHFLNSLYFDHNWYMRYEKHFCDTNSKNKNDRLISRIFGFWEGLGLLSGEA